MQQQHGCIDQGSRTVELIATLAHELRGPLGPLRSGIHLLRSMKSGDPNVGNVADMMERQSDQLVRLIDDFLDVGRIMRGTADLRRSRYRVSERIRSIVHDFTPSVEERGLALELHIVDDGLVIDADPLRIEQVLDNLLTNAAKYTDHGGRIDVYIRREAAAAVIEVCDSGIGIPTNALESVFEMFVQLPQHRQHSGGGLGIGLALARRLVELHGGRLTAASAGLDAGTTFTMRLPLSEPGT